MTIAARTNINDVDRVVPCGAATHFRPTTTHKLPLGARMATPSACVSAGGSFIDDDDR